MSKNPESFRTYGEISVYELLEHIQRHYAYFYDDDKDYKVTIELIGSKDEE